MLSWLKAHHSSSWQPILHSLDLSKWALTPASTGYHRLNGRSTGLSWTWPFLSITDKSSVENQSLFMIIKWLREGASKTRETFLFQWPTSCVCAGKSTCMYFERRTVVQACLRRMEQKQIQVKVQKLSQTRNGRTIGKTRLCSPLRKLLSD